MSYEIETIENEGKPVRNYDGQNGTVYVFQVTTTEGALAEVGKQKGSPQKGDVYKILKEPSEKAPEGALPTLREKDYEVSPPPVNGASNGSGDSPQGTINTAEAARQARIGRQSAQQRAALYLIAKAMCKQHGVDLDLEAFIKLVDSIEKDAG